MNSTTTLHEAKVLNTERWLTLEEIHALLSKVEYIVLAEPNMDENSPVRIHFTIFFNTSELIPAEYVQAILEKFSKEHHLKDIENFVSTLGDVTFAKTSEETPLPYYIQHNKDKGNSSDEEKLQVIKLFIFDFYANATQGFEEITKGLTGWSYVYQED